MSKAAVTIICTLLVINFWFAARIVHIENQRYALSLGLCSGDATEALRRQADCLEAAETRTSPIYHLVYALGLLN